MQRYPNLPDPREEERDAAAAINRSRDAMYATVFFGMAMIAAGIIMTFYFAVGYDATVETTIPGETVGWGENRFTTPERHERVNNLGLEENRLIGVLCGLGLCGMGGGLLLMAKLMSMGREMERAADAVEATGEIVARQDAEWRKKGADPNQAEDTPPNP